MSLSAPTLKPPHRPAPAHTPSTRLAWLHPAPAVRWAVWLAFIAAWSTALPARGRSSPLKPQRLTIGCARSFWRNFRA